MVDRKLRSDPRLLQEELRQPKLRRSANPSRVHEVAAALHQLSAEVWRALRRCWPGLNAYKYFVLFVTGVAATLS